MYIKRAGIRVNYAPIGTNRNNLNSCKQTDHMWGQLFRNRCSIPSELTFRSWLSILPVPKFNYDFGTLPCD